MGLIKKVPDKDLYEIEKDLNKYILDKGSVFKYYYSDDFEQEIRTYKDFLIYTSRVKVYTEEEIKIFQEKRESDVRNTKN